MPKSLHMKGNDYNVAVLVFTVAYVVFGMPANLIVKKMGPKVLVVYMFCWGMPRLLTQPTNTGGGYRADDL